MEKIEKQYHDDLYKYLMRLALFCIIAIAIIYKKPELLKYEISALINLILGYWTLFFIALLYYVKKEIPKAGRTQKLSLPMHILFDFAIYYFSFVLTMIFLSSIFILLGILIASPLYLVFINRSSELVELIEEILKTLTIKNLMVFSILALFYHYYIHKYNGHPDVGQLIVSLILLIIVIYDRRLYIFNYIKKAFKKQSKTN